ncbi:2-oxoglutarate dehydrogenase E1 component [Salmonella enterica subsp. enterica]|uniref:2-oxoglutarate dehydrogenase E1 component n=1 Tax=Salmonella enterica I TaxID=59201 RepID=A0A379WC09_SALET|nr:2-oxoglutarate dehydrogenase E1 component [Salmonella enterica subsp. enterica]
MRSERVASDEHALLHLVAISQPRMDESYPNKVEMKRLQELAKRISTVPEAIEMPVSRGENLWRPSGNGGRREIV